MRSRRKIAFIFASNGPDNLNPLKYAIEDANRIARSLASPACGFTVVRPTRGSDPFDLRRQLSTVTESCRPEDVIICYFSGHGVLERGNLFLLWDNTDRDRPISTAIPISDVLQALQYCKAKGKLLILDCCHAGAVAEKVGVKNAVGTPVADTNVHADNHLVLMASGRVESARELDELQGSFLTVNLCAALDNKLYDADIDNDGRLSITDLVGWLQGQAREHNKNFPDHKVPTPYLFGRQKGQFFFTWEETDWLPYEFVCADGSVMVVLPIFGRYSDRVLCVSKYPVLNKQYKRFVSYTQTRAYDQQSEPIGESFVENEWKGPFYPWREDAYSHPDQPVVCVTYGDAGAYCKWTYWADRWAHHEASSEQPKTPRSEDAIRAVDEDYVDSVAPALAAVRLATGAEWDFAAYGSVYPNRHPRSWLSRTSSVHHLASSPARIDPTGNRSNAWGLSDMFGNVWEWCREEDDMFPRIAATLDITDMYKYSGGADLRGGSFLDDLNHVEPRIHSRMLRDGMETSHCDLGFRIAGEVSLQDIPEETRARLEAWRGVRVTPSSLPHLGSIGRTDRVGGGVSQTGLPDSG